MNNIVKIAAAAGLLALMPSQASAKVTLPAIFSDGMVLQQQSSVALWGTTDRKGKAVEVKTSWNDSTYTVKPDRKGDWRLKITTGEYGGPYTISISDGTTTTIDDVLLGEVWLCSGQSNMDMRVDGQYGDPVIGALEATVTSENPDIRMFTVGHKLISEPQYDCTGQWEEASPATVPEFSAAAYFFARKLYDVLHVPVGIIHTSYGGSRVEAWMSAESVAPYQGVPEVHDESILYNGMLAPVLGYGIKGCLWYQGEANVDAPDHYTKLLPAMVADWRKRWDMGEFPFYYAQIAPYNYNKGEGKGENSAYLREAQLKCTGLIPSSGMIVLLDIGDPVSIHPMEKLTVGNRFAYLALSDTYGLEGFPASGPVYKSAVTDGNKMIVNFDGVGKGLTSFHKPLTGFEVAGDDYVFHPAEAYIGNDRQTVVVSSPEVPHPVAVRYGFKDYVDGSLYNFWGLPASSFRSDNR